MSFIEVSERCDMSQPPSKEQLYEIYKELREDGIIWTDAKASNVGKLLKPNKKYSKKIGEKDDKGNIIWGSQKYAGTGAGFETQTENQDVLNAGEYVIVDLDFIWEEDYKKIIWPTGGTLSLVFENRYKREKANENAERGKEDNCENLEKDEI